LLSCDLNEQGKLDQFAGLRVLSRTELGTHAMMIANRRGETIASDACL